jgi:polysaccharide pyruvyl transferase WcaK-like protein
MGSHAKKIMFLGAGFTTNNMGVWALASGTVASALHAFPDAEIFFFDYHSAPQRYEVIHPSGTARIDLINIRFSKKVWMPNNIARLILTAALVRLLPFKFFRDKVISKNLWLRHIQTADLIGSIAGGDSFSDIYGMRRLLYVSLPQILMILMGKPLVFLPQTIGPFRSFMGKWVARYILKRAHRVYSRDLQSIEEVRGIVGDHGIRIECFYDMGFALEPSIRNDNVPAWLAGKVKAEPLVGLNVSGLLYIGGYTQNNMFGLKCNYRILIYNIIEYFIRNHGAHVMLVPHVFGRGDNRESDLSACRAIFGEAESGLQSHIHIIEEGYNHHEIKALIGRCDFFVGSRMHACIAALSQSVPAVGIAYSRKFMGVFESIGMQDLVVDLRKQTDASILSIINDIYNRRSEFRKDLQGKMPAVRKQVMNFFLNPMFSAG